MQRRDRPELWRCELCWPPCDDPGRCRRAHALQDLLPPVEAVHLFAGRWSQHCVDRWYSQHLAEEQLTRILGYHAITPRGMVPAWTAGLVWFLQELDIGLWPELGWDFNLSQDLEGIRRARKNQQWPFHKYLQRERCGIWTALYLRRDYLSGGIQRPLSVAHPEPGAADAGPAVGARYVVEATREPSTQGTGQSPGRLDGAPGTLPVAPGVEQVPPCVFFRRRFQ